MKKTIITKKSDNNLVTAFMDSVDKDFQRRLVITAADIQNILEWTYLKERVTGCKICRSAMKAAYTKHPDVFSSIRYFVEAMGSGDHNGIRFNTIVMLDNGEFYGFADASIFRLKVENSKLKYRNDIVTYDCILGGCSRLTKHKIAIKFEVSDIFITLCDEDIMKSYSDDMIIK